MSSPILLHLIECHLQDLVPLFAYPSVPHNIPVFPDFRAYHYSLFQHSKFFWGILYDILDSINELPIFSYYERKYHFAAIPNFLSLFTEPKHMATSLRCLITACTQVIACDVSLPQVHLGGQDIFASPPCEISNFVWRPHAPNSFPQ